MRLLLVSLACLTAIATAAAAIPSRSTSTPPCPAEASCSPHSFPNQFAPPNPPSQSVLHSPKIQAISTSSNEQLHGRGRTQDRLIPSPLTKCRWERTGERKEAEGNGSDEQQFCLVSRQEFISQAGGDKKGGEYVWVALTLAFGVAACAYYRARLGLLLQVMAAVELRADARSNEYAERLKELDELRKIYQVDWDRVIYRSEGDVCYDHAVYEGRFLTQETYVYAVPLDHADVPTLEHKLGRLLNCSHRRLAKLYYYTRTPELMLIFTEKIAPLSQKDLGTHFATLTSLPAKKNAIVDIIQTLSYLEEKIELKLLPLESIQLDIVQTESRGQAQTSYDYKINTIPCLFRKMNYHCSADDQDTASEEGPTCLVRLNIAELFHLMLLEGRTLDERRRGQGEWNEEYVQFLEFILYEARAVGHTHGLLFREVLEHPFLWDTKRKMLFLADFSNYIETHLDEARLARLERHAREHRVIRPNWIREFHSVFASEVNFYRKYDFQSVRDLIRMIRNKLNHFHEIPKDVKAHIGRTPDGFLDYCLTIFPRLLPFAYVYTRKKKWKLHMK